MGLELTPDIHPLGAMFGPSQWITCTMYNC